MSLLHEALKNQASLADREHGTLSPPLRSARSVTSDDATTDDEDDVYTPVHTRPATPTQATSRSRQTARPSTPGGSRSSSPSRLAKKRMQEEEERKASRDPLWRFPNEISSRIFRELDTEDLKAVMRVSKRWNRSATINWCWYLQFQKRRAADTLSTEPVWTRRESKENWPARYRSAFTLNGLQYKTAFQAEYEAARSDGYRTPKELREEKWQAEELQNRLAGEKHEYKGEEKIAMREYYKSLGGRKSKTKGESRGGGGAAGPRDLTAYGDDDGY